MALDIVVELHDNLFISIGDEQNLFIPPELSKKEKIRNPEKFCVRSHHFASSPMQQTACQTTIDL